MRLTYLDQYHFFNATIMPERPVVVKVGVDGIDDLQKMVGMYPKGDIFAYEADPRNYDKWLNPAKDLGIYLYNYAIGPTAGGKMKLYRFVNTVSNSEFPRHTHDPNCKLVDSVEVNTKSIVQVADEVKRNISLLILNCEGGELHIMRALYDESIRKRIDQICVSFHDPRIYATKHREEILTKLEPFYHVFRGNCPHGGIPDYLLILRK
jgi:FkbM family methyltransferase